MSQALLFPDPRPLVERLGRDFFRHLPDRPGVYLMRDALDTVLYVGKAKNLRKRLGSYRVANPDRLARRHLRLLRAVERIELQECPDETSALAREAELLRSLKPKFNRAGTWPAKPRFLNWRATGEKFELSVTESPVEPWQNFGPTGASAIVLRGVLVRLIWFAVHPHLGFVGMPAGWAQGNFGNSTAIACGEELQTITAHTTQLFSGQSHPFCDWTREKTTDRLHPFEKNVVETDLDYLREFFDRIASARLFSARE
jgi:predicted GIY-YIG superfamily endonuclease